MSKVLVSENNLSAIADSIRAKNGTQETYTPGEMSAAIDNLPSGGGDFAITDTSYLFRSGSRLNAFNDLKPYFSGNTTTCDYMFQYTGSGIADMNLFFDTSNCQQFIYMFQGCSYLKTAPSYDLSKARYCSYMFCSCSTLENVPVYNLSASNFNSSGHNNMFQYCTALTDESLNNIMASLMTIQVTSSSVAKTLKYVGLTSDQATRCQSLSNYQAFIDAGWTTGY